MAVKQHPISNNLLKNKCYYVLGFRIWDTSSKIYLKSYLLYLLDLNFFKFLLFQVYSGFEEPSGHSLL